MSRQRSAEVALLSPKQPEWVHSPSFDISRVSLDPTTGDLAAIVRVATQPGSCVGLPCIAQPSRPLLNPTFSPTKLQTKDLVGHHYDFTSIVYTLHPL